MIHKPIVEFAEEFLKIKKENDELREKIDSLETTRKMLEATIEILEKENSNLSFSHTATVNSILAREEEETKRLQDQIEILEQQLQDEDHRKKEESWPRT